MKKIFFLFLISLFFAPVFAFAQSEAPTEDATGPEEVVEDAAGPSDDGDGQAVGDPSQSGVTEDASESGDDGASGTQVDDPEAPVGSGEVDEGDSQESVSGEIIIKADEDEASVYIDYEYSGDELIPIIKSAMSDLSYNDDDFEEFGREFEKFSGAAATLFWLTKLLVIFVAAMVLTLLIPKTSTKIVRLAHDKFWLSLLIGLVFLVVAPIVALILLFTVAGLYVALIAAMLHCFVILLALPLANIFAGSLIFKWAKKESKCKVSWLSTLVGSPVLQIIVFIPVLGWLVALVMVSVIAGAGLLFGYNEMLKIEKGK